MERIVTISNEKYQLWGCPYCGCSLRFLLQSDRARTSIVRCGECNRTYVIFSFEGMTEPLYPKLEEHPRKGIPSHGYSDKCLKNGGEFFWPCAIVPGNCSCFICGETLHEDRGFNNMTGFALNEDAGKRVVAMLGQGTRLDDREYGLNEGVRIRVGACDQHSDKLEALFNLLHKDHVLTKEKIDKANRGEE